MNFRFLQLSAVSAIQACLLVTAVGLVTTPTSIWAAQGKSKNPTSKLFVADVSGDAVIDTGEALEDLAKRSVYTAQGTTIETKKPESESERSKYYSTMVYSNGTGAFFDADTRVEMRTFIQEPFTPNRADIESEPSISQTQAFVARGTIGLCNSKLVAGSNMNYQTPHGSVTIRGRKVVIEANGGVTKISMLEGDSTVRSGPSDVSGHTVKTGEQAIIRPGPPGQPNTIEVEKIPPAEMPKLDDKVAMACMAKKTVYFEVRERTIDGGDKSVASQSAPDTRGDSTAAPTSNGAVTAFDGNSGTASNVTIRELVPVEVIPIRLPVENVVSPARIVTASGGPGG